MTPNDANRQSETVTIATTCLTHLQAEEQALEQLEIVLRRNRQALAEHDTHSLVEVGGQLNAHREVSTKMAERRHQLQQTLGTWLGIAPEHVTLSRVVEKLEGDVRDRIDEVQRRLRERVRQLSQLLQGNVMIAVQHNLIVGQTLAMLTGQVELKRYGATGQLQDRPASSLFEAEL